MINENLQKNTKETDIMSAQERYLRKLAASKEPLYICLTNDYAFRKIFKNKKVLKGFHHYVSLQDTKTEEMYNSKFVFHVIELKKLEETPEAERDELYRWARLIAAKSWEAVDMEAKGNPYREEAREEMKKINQDEVERWLYLRREMAVSDKVSQIASAERRGKRQGRNEGSLLRLVSQIQKKCRKGKSLEIIANEVEEDVEEIREIYELICQNPGESEEKILDLLQVEE